MDFDFDDGQDAPYTPAVDRYIARSSTDLPEPEHDEPREFKRGIPCTEQELAGVPINLCTERLAKQTLNDSRAAEREDLRPLGGRLDLIDVVNEACASAWDAEKYLAKHRHTVRQILSKPCNEIRRSQLGMSKRQKRHQRGLRLVRALAFDGVTQADYCRWYRISKATASEMLAHLYEKEPGLADAIGAICACAAGTSWQRTEQKRIARNRERARKEVHLIFGLNDPINSIAPFPSQASTPRMMRDGGGFRNLSLATAPRMVRDPILGGFRYSDDKPVEPEDKPRYWYSDVLADEIALAVFNLRATPIRAASPYRYQRPLRRRVTLRSKKTRDWNPIGRAVPMEDRGLRSHDPGLVMSWPVADHDFLKRPPAVLKMPPRLRPSPRQNASVIASGEYIRLHGGHGWSYFAGPRLPDVITNRLETPDEIRRDFFGLRPTGAGPSPQASFQCQPPRKVTWSPSSNLGCA
jgi:hypothetical protein